jgi:hypothetical protein
MEFKELIVKHFETTDRANHKLELFVTTVGEKVAAVRAYNIIPNILVLDEEVKP